MKDGGLAIGISIVSVMISAISTLISVLSFWKMRHPKYSITISSGDKTYSIENIPSDKFQDLVTEFETGIKSDVNVIITEKM